MYNFARFHTTLFKNGMCSNVRHSSGQFVDVTQKGGMVKSSNRVSRKDKREKFKRCSRSVPISHETTRNHHVREPAKSTTKNTLEMPKPASAEDNSEIDDRSYIINVFLKDQQASKDGSINIRIRDADVNPEDISLKELTKNIQQNYSTIDKICKSSLGDLETRDNKSVFVKKFERLWCDVFRLSKVQKVEANLLNAVRTDEIEERVRKDVYVTSSKTRKESVAEESSEGNKEELAADINDSQREAMEDSVVSSRAEETANESVLSQDAENKMEENLTVASGKSNKSNRRRILSEDFENTINSKTSVISSNEGDLENKPQYDPEVASTSKAKEVKEQTLFEDSENEVDQTFAVSNISNEKTTKETAKRSRNKLDYDSDFTSKISRRRHEEILFDDSEHGIGKEAGIGTSKSDKEVSERITIEEKERASTEKELHKEEEEYTKDDHPIVSSTKIDDVEYDRILARDLRTEGEENLKSSSKTRPENKTETQSFKQGDENLKEDVATVSSTKINETANEEVLVRDIRLEDEENSNKISPRQMTYPILQDNFDPEPISDQSNRVSLEKGLVEEQIVKSINRSFEDDENAPIISAKDQMVKKTNEKSFEQDDENIENDAISLAKEQMVRSRKEKSLKQDDENIENDAITLAEDQMIKSRDQKSLKQDDENIENDAITLAKDQMIRSRKEKSLKQDDEEIENDAISLAKDQMVESRDQKSFKQDDENVENNAISLAKDQMVKSRDQKSLKQDDENVENDAISLAKNQMVKSRSEKSLEQNDENIENDAIILDKDRMVKSRNEKSFKQDHVSMKSTPTASTVQLNEVANKTLTPDVVMQDEEAIRPPRKRKTLSNRMTYPVLQENLDPNPISDRSNKVSLEKALVMDQINNNKNNRAPETKKINDNKKKTVVNKYQENKKKILNSTPNNPERLKRLNGRNKKQVETVIKLASPPQPETTLGKITNFCKGLFKTERVASEDAETTKEDNFIDRTMQPKKLCIPQKNAFDMRYRFLPPQRSEPEYKTDNPKPRKRRAGSMKTITNDAVFQQKCGVRERILSTRYGKFKDTQRKPQYSTQNFLNKTFSNAKELPRNSFTGTNFKVCDERKRWYSNKGSCREDGEGKGSSETEVVCETNRCESPKDIEDIEKGVLGATSKCLAIRNPDKPAEPLPMEEPCDEKDECDPRWKTVVKPVEPKFDIMDHIGDLASNDPTGDIENYYGKNGYKNLEYYKYRPCSYYDMIRYMAKKRNPQPNPFCPKNKHEDEDSC